MDRREFLKAAGLGSAALGVAACGGRGTAREQAETTLKGISGEMEYRRGPREDKVSLLGYGCMRWQMIKDENGRDIINQQSVDELVDFAMAHGVNLFDTSPMYLQGQSEAATAKALAKYPRDSYYISTKLSNFQDWSLEGSKAMYRKSLKTFNTDHIDYYLLHNIADESVFKRRFKDSGLMDFLLKEREQGRIRNLGFSFHGSYAGFEELLAYHEIYHWDFVLIQMNYIDWNNGGASKLYEALDRLEIPVMIMEPLLGGRLANVPMAIAEQLKSREPQRSVPSWAFRFVGSYPRVLTVLSGMTWMSNLEDNLSTFCGFQPLSEEEREWLGGDIATRLSQYPLVPCTECQYCMPCKYGIDIPGIFKFYNKAVNEGTYVVSSEQEGYAKLRKKYLTAYNRSIESIRQADHCIGCNECVVHCPQHIRIPQQLRRIDSYMEKLKKETL